VHRPHEADVTPVGERVNAERILLLGWTRAILLQLSHPLIAAGVAEHSGFREGRFGSLLRLRHTVRAMLSLTFGTEAERNGALAAIGRIHRRVNGRLREPVGPFPAGTRYSAEDPALLLWVHATLIESSVRMYELLVAPLLPRERDRYCQEVAPIARALGAAEVPVSWTALAAYVEGMYGSGRIVVSETARTLASAVLAPRFAVMTGPAARLNRLIATGLLPDAIREQYGFRWHARDEAAFRRWVTTLRVLRRLSPRVIATWPEARRRRPAARTQELAGCGHDTVGIHDGR
jgi:uncharacterized protein (DUF2236 family)